LAVPALKQIIIITAKQRDEWEDSSNGITWKILKRTVATHQNRQQLIVASEEDEQEVTYTSNIIDLKHLQSIQDGIVSKLKKARRTLADQENKLKEMQKTKRGHESAETKLFKVLKKLE
jgi:hypothetical protein